VRYNLLEQIAASMFSAALGQGSSKNAPTRPIRRSVVQGAESGEQQRTLRDAPDDLLNLEDFNDNELLRALWIRYERKEIYTWVGSVLVSVNPYRDIGVFRDELAARYASNNPPQAPHLFATVKAALTAPGDRHALLITGESGAGKTEATRAVLSCLAMQHGATDHIRDRLLRSTPVLEAFGNAHTRQNTNSSRFGKFIEVHLSTEYEVVGATLTPYMLEASRVAGDLPQGERTYHVFYLLRAALGALASGTTPTGSFWTRLSNAPEWADLVSAGALPMTNSARLTAGPPDMRCAEWFEALHEGLVKIGMRHVEVAECCRIVAAVSLLADMTAGNTGLAAAAALLRIEENELGNFLTKAEMSVGAARKERLHRARSEHEAATLRASLAQELYAALFGWLTQLVARGIKPPAQGGVKMLGLLDLYGFEVFSTNGFEQFLINYCNERLQQFFNRQVFTIEAEEYAAEGLDTDGQWRRMITACQLPALALLEGEFGVSVGCFGIINDRSRCGFEDQKQDGGSALAQAIAVACGSRSGFLAAGRDSRRFFGVAHFAGEVFYDAAQFQSKNASAHRPDIHTFLRRHGGEFVREVLIGEAKAEPLKREPSVDASPASSSADALPSTSASTVNGNSQRKLFGRTLISVFREELNELCAALEQRQCRHVRCLRPNDDQAPLVFDDASMLRQCRYSGLLEATRIRRQGYAHRRPLRSFAARFALLLGTREARRVARHVPAANASMACQAILQAASASGISADDATIGHTKVFLREGALVWFESARTRVAIGVIVALLRGNYTRSWLARLKKAAILLQAVARSRRAQRFTAQLRAEIQAEKLRAEEELRAAEERAVAEAAAAAAHAAAMAAAEARRLSSACRLQRWWRRRTARECSMIAAVRREKEQLKLKREQLRWMQAEEIQLSRTPPGTSPVMSPAATPVLPLRTIAMTPDQGERPLRPGLSKTTSQESLRRISPHGSIRGAKPTKDYGLRQPFASGQPSASPSVKEKQISSSAATAVVAAITTGQAVATGLSQSRRVGMAAPRPRTPPPSAEDRRRAEIHSARHHAGSGNGQQSPRSLRRSYRQEIARLLAQHRQLRKRLPAELRGLPAELMEAAHKLGHNGPPVAPEVLTRINEVLQTLKAALKEHSGPTLPLSHVPSIASLDRTPILPGGRGLRQDMPGERHGWFQAPATARPVLQRVASNPTNLHQTALAFNAPHLAEVGDAAMRRSLSARPMRRSPHAGFRSPLRTPPTMTRTLTPTRGFRTPVRQAHISSHSKLPLPSTPVGTPRHIFRVTWNAEPGTPTGAPSTMPAWQAHSSSPSIVTPRQIIQIAPHGDGVEMTPGRQRPAAATASPVPVWAWHAPGQAPGAAHKAQVAASPVMSSASSFNCAQSVGSHSHVPSPVEVGLSQAVLAAVPTPGRNRSRRLPSPVSCQVATTPATPTSQVRMLSPPVVPRVVGVPVTRS